MRGGRAPAESLLLLTLISGGLVSSAAADDGPCNLADEYLDPANNYQYVYNGTVELLHSVAGHTSAAGFSFTCVVVINGEQPCYHSLQLSMCSLDDRTTHADKAARQHSFNRLLKRGHIHFRLAASELEQVYVDPEEAAFITNVRRGFLHVLRISRPRLERPGKTVDGDCEWTVSRTPSGRQRVERSRGCDPAQNQPSVLSPFSPISSLRVLEDQLAVSSACEYEADWGELRAAACRQTWQLHPPGRAAADLVQVVVTQDLSLLSTRAADPPLERNTRQAGAAFQLQDSAPFVDVGDNSVFGRLRDLISSSVPLMTPETPQKFTNLLRALRRKYENPLHMSDNCTDCATFGKEVMDSAARTAVLQCGSAACLREVAAMVRSGELTGARLTPLYLTWHWTTIRDVESAHSMYSLCELAPTRWCLLGLAGALRRSAAAGPRLTAVVDRLRRTAVDMIGSRCEGGDTAVLMALKTLSNLGDLALDDFATLSVVRSCASEPSRPVLVASEAVRTLDRARLPPKFATVLQDLYKDERHALVTRQLAYLALLRRFPTERWFRMALRWATAHPSDALSTFVMRHFKRFPRTDPRRALTRRVAAALSVDLEAVTDGLFNSPSVSTVRELRLDRWLQMALPSVPAPEAGVQLWRLHGASFLPHLLLLNTTLRLGGGGATPLQLELRAVDFERFLHDLVRDPEFDLTTARGALREVAQAVLAAFGGWFGGVSFVSASGAAAPGQLRLSPDVSAWLRRLLQAYQARTALPDGQPRAVLTVSVMGSQLAYLTADDVISRLEAFDPPPEPIHVLGRKLFHSETIFKFLEGQHRVALAVGLPLQMFADGTLAAGAAAEISSRLGRSYRNMSEAFNGDAQLSASVGLSVVVGLEVALPPFARTGLQLNSTAYAPFSLNVSYAVMNRTVRLTAPKPDRKRTLLLLSHGAQLRQGEALRPSPAADARAVHCLPQAVYTGLSVCRELRTAGRLGLTAPVIYHVTAENTEQHPFDTYTLDVWTTAREDGYQHGGLAHVYLHRPAARAADLRLRLGFRLMPINYNPLLFHRGQKANTTLELVVGEEDKPLWYVYLIRAHTEQEDVLFSESRGWLMARGKTLLSAEMTREQLLPWLAPTGRRDNLYIHLMRTGHHVRYNRRYSACSRPDGDVQFSADLSYATAFHSGPLLRLLPPQFYDADKQTAWLRLNLSRQVTANDEVSWPAPGADQPASAAQAAALRHLTAATVGVTLAGLLNWTATADSSARLVANLSSLETRTGRTLMYTAASGRYDRQIEGGVVTDGLQAALSYPGTQYEGRLRLDRDDYSFNQSSRLWWSRHDLELSSRLEADNSASALQVYADLALNRPAPAVTARSPAAEVGLAGMERTITQSSASPVWDLLDHQLQGTVRTDCLNCSTRQRDLDLKLEHKWLRLRSSSSRQLDDSGAAAGGVQKLDIQLDSTADFLPSMSCKLRPDGDLHLALTLPALGPPPKLDVRYTLKPPSRWQKVFVRALEVDISDGRRGRPVPALRLSLETTPADPSRLSAELEAQPSLWLAAGSALVQRLRATVGEARRALLRPDYGLNVLLRPLTGTDTLADWLYTLPAKRASGMFVGRAAPTVGSFSAVCSHPTHLTLAGSPSR
ncbi:apolipoprotein B-100-like [Pollicipes pollicipes]|uniref:apolipoprotein B-100-like n=1 Tax=Pollicipes pollicipes TaxID=41117 RepID=UPI0018851474|nr:apolipoprotein B-100-like [Pollicipes pollicipes]